MNREQEINEALLATRERIALVNEIAAPYLQDIAQLKAERDEARELIRRATPIIRKFYGGATPEDLRLALARWDAERKS